MNSTLVHGLQLMERMATNSEPVSVSWLAQEVGIAKSQTHRLLQSLKAEGYVEQLADRRYQVGLRPLRITAGIMTAHPLRRAALPLLRRLSESTDCDAVLSVLHGDRALVIATDYHQGRQVDAFNVLGRTAQLHAWANGKVLLAFTPLDEQEALLNRLELTRFNERTLTTRAALAREILAVRNRGWALNDRENSDVQVSVSVPVFDEFHRCIAACGASWPDGRRPAAADRTKTITALRRAAADLTAALRSVPVRPTTSASTTSASTT